MLFCQKAAKGTKIKFYMVAFFYKKNKKKSYLSGSKYNWYE
jgi:hypothetical protein